MTNSAARPRPCPPPTPTPLALRPPPLPPPLLGICGTGAGGTGVPDPPPPPVTPGSEKKNGGGGQTPNPCLSASPRVSCKTFDQSSFPRHSACWFARLFLKTKIPVSQQSWDSRDGQLKARLTAHTLLYHPSPGLRAIKKTKRRESGPHQMKVERGWAVIGPPIAMSGTVRSVCGTAIFSRMPPTNAPRNCKGRGWGVGELG